MSCSVCHLYVLLNKLSSMVSIAQCFSVATTRHLQCVNYLSVKIHRNDLPFSSSLKRLRNIVHFYFPTKIPYILRLFPLNVIKAYSFHITRTVSLKFRPLTLTVAPFSSLVVFRLYNDYISTTYVVLDGGH
jgi:hypothetical protein